MRKIVLFLLTMLMSLPLYSAAKDIKGEKVRLAGISQLRGNRPVSASRAKASRQGVTAKLQYVQIADMKVPRISHQTFVAGGKLIVVGGRTTNFNLTSTAEVYSNGAWQSIRIGNPHDGAFCVQLADGRTMVGGGFSSRGGAGQSTATDIYDPRTETFAGGPALTTARAQAMALNTGSRVYVSGNWYAKDPTMDCYNGSTFTQVGDMDARTSPYMMFNSEGDVLVMSAYDTQGESFGFYTYDDGSKGLLCDVYHPSTGRTKYLGLPFDETTVPMPLSDDVRPTDYQFTYNGHKCYAILTRTSGGYKLYMFDYDDLTVYLFNTLSIPTADDAGQSISWRGGVIVNEARQELYLIGASGSTTAQTLHVISLNYVSDDWTIASATGFGHNMLTASWTLMADGQLACTGGGINDNTDAQAAAYLISPEVAGSDGGSPDDPHLVDRQFLVVETKDHTETTYMLSNRPQVIFMGNSLRVVSGNFDTTYEMADILRFTYRTMKVSGINEVRQADTTVDYENGELIIGQLPQGADVGVYALDGKLVRQLKARRSGTYRLQLGELPRGVYLVKANRVTYKIMKR